MRPVCRYCSWRTLLLAPHSQQRSQYGGLRADINNGQLPFRDSATRSDILESPSHNFKYLTSALLKLISAALPYTYTCGILVIPATLCFTARPPILLMV
jgi:hypothetical protein